MRLLLLIPLLILTACSSEAPPPPIPEVVVQAVTLEPYQPKSSYVGRLHAKDDVTIQAKVTGYLLSRDFREGDLVQQGDVLYTIDPAEYEAALARAEADLAAAQANLSNTERNYKRGRELLPKGAISEAEMDNLTATKLDAEANLKAAEAQIKSAQVNLDYTTIKAPITGRIGRTQLSPGDLVGPNSGDLTTLVSIDPIQALFQVSEAIYITTRTRVGEGGLPSVRDLRDIEVSLELTNGLIYPQVGRIDYFSNRIDENTGTLEARASIPNPDGVLVPGQYVRVVLQDTHLLEGLFIPQAAVQADQQGSFVLIVDSNSKVQRRNVDLSDRLDENVLVNRGVDEGDQVIVRGLQQVRPGSTVKFRTLPKAEDSDAPDTDASTTVTDSAAEH